MEDVIKKILNMDKETVKVRRETEETVSRMGKELRETLQSLENKYLEEGRLEGDKKYKDIIEASRKEIEQHNEKEGNVLENIESIYMEKKHNLVEELFQSLLSEE